MKTDRRLILIAIALSVFCVFTGCAVRTGPTAFDTACDLFKKGDFEEAEAYFVTALETENYSPVKQLGHAYNLIALGEKEKALDELIDVEDGFKDEAVRTAVRKTILDIYLESENYAGAARVCEELASIVTDADSKDYYTMQMAVIRADMYRNSDEPELLREELYRIIGLKTFAPDEYYELYDMLSDEGCRIEKLRLADEILAYMTGHSSYISDYRPIIGIAFDAAETAEYTDGGYDSNHYFNEAETFIKLARENSLNDNDILKYDVIIAERRGKMNLAYKLLGVYLNHCPDDPAALKELRYLENRLGIEGE